MVKQKINTTTFSSIDMSVTMIDQNKIEKLLTEREKIIFDMDKLKLQQMKKVVKIDEQIKKARKGKTIRKKLKNGR